MLGADARARSRRLRGATPAAHRVHVSARGSARALGLMPLRGAAVGAGRRHDPASSTTAAPSCTGSPSTPSTGRRPATRSAARPPGLRRLRVGDRRVPARRARPTRGTSSNVFSLLAQYPDRAGTRRVRHRASIRRPTRSSTRRRIPAAATAASRRPAPRRASPTPGSRPRSPG